MTTEEKFTAIVERLKADGWCDDPNIVSVMMIINYLDKLEKEGLVECAFSMSDKGRTIAAICEEFDWQPSDLDVRRFIDEMVEKEDGPAFSYMIKRWRDDREGLLEEVKKFRESERGF